MSTFDLDRSNISDSDLIEHVRAGDTAAFAVLHDRHAGSARALARRMSRSTADADDLVNEGFARVLRALQNGKGPDITFRPYLLSTIRRLAYDRTTREQRESPSATHEAPEPAAQTSDPVLDGFERETAAAAFASLPERWRMVLWHTEVEGQSPAEVAELLGMKANAVAALAYRAREGLRQAYLTEHTPKAGSTKECELTAGRLGSYVRGGLTPAREASVRRHLEECDDCQAAYLELASVNTSMPAIVAFAVLGPFGFGYLAKASGTAGAAFQRAISPLIQVDASAAGSGGVLAGAGAVGAGAARRVRHLAAVAAATVVVGAVAVIAAVHGGGGPNVQRTATGPTNSGPVVDTVSTPARPRSAAPSPDTAATSTSTMPSTIPPQPTTNHPAAPTTTEDGPGGSTGIAPPKRPPESSRMTVTVDSAGHLVRNRPGVLVADVSNAGAGTGRNARLTLDLRGATLRGLPEAPILDRSDAWDCDLVSPTSLACERNSVAADDTTSVYVPVSVSAGTAPVEVHREGHRSTRRNRRQFLTSHDPSRVGDRHGGPVRDRRPG